LLFSLALPAPLCRLALLSSFLHDPEYGQTSLGPQRPARPADVPLDGEALLLRAPAKDAEREFESMPLQLDRHQVPYGAIQRVVTPVQIALDARDHLGRVLASHSPSRAIRDRSASAARTFAVATLRSIWL